MSAYEEEYQEKYGLEKGAEPVDDVEAAEEVRPHAPEVHREIEGDDADPTRVSTPPILSAALFRAASARSTESPKTATVISGRIH